MTLISVSVDTFIYTSVAVATPLVYFLRRQSSNPDAPLRQTLNVLVLLHTLYVLYVLTVLWPPNLFQRLNIPLTMPSDSIRYLILQKAGLEQDATLPKALESLLTRLSSFDMRTLYVRFGQTVLQDCEHCTTFDEYSLYALPWPLLEYIREAAVIGLLTIQGSGRERWRTYGVAAVVIAAILEGYWVASATIQVPRNGLGVYMLHDNLWLLRQLLFLVLPIVIHLLPASPPESDPVNTLHTTRNTLELTLTRLTSLRYLRGAVMRDPTLRASATKWWSGQKVAGVWIREDDAVQKTAQKLGYGFVGSDEEAKLRTSARATTGAIASGLGISYRRT
ncbi:unnamed protein product [Somion occarium]|uniref:Uncharacterized protein n=1 Tax=Somion occarium TaxID=3059160 RepID=A0ABP1DLB8_9APHY